MEAETALEVAGRALLLGVALAEPRNRGIARIAAEAELVEALRAARKQARAQAWGLGVAPDRVTIDLDVRAFSGTRMSRPGQQIYTYVDEAGRREA